MLVIQRQQFRDVQPLGAVADTVVAGGAGESGLAHHAAGHLHQTGHLFLIEGGLGLEGGDVGLHLLQVGHAGEDHSDAGDGLEEPEGPGGDGLVGAHGLQGRGLLITEAGQAAAPEGLHHPHGDVVLVQQVHLFLAVLESPVDVVELQLAELHVLAVGLQEPLEHRHRPVAGEAQVADAAVLLLLHQVVIDAVLGVQVGVDVHLAHVVEQVEVEVVHLALFELFLEDLLHLGHVGQVVAGEFVGNVEFLPGIPGQSLAQRQLGVAAVVAPGGVVVVHAAGHGLVHHLKGGRLVHLGVVPVNDGQAHAAHAQGGQLQILKLFVDHWYYPFPSHGASHAALPEAAAYCPSGLICSLVLCYSLECAPSQEFFRCFTNDRPPRRLWRFLPFL